MQQNYIYIKLNIINYLIPVKKNSYCSTFIDTNTTNYYYTVYLLTISLTLSKRVCPAPARS